MTHTALAIHAECALKHIYLRAVESRIGYLSHVRGLEPKCRPKPVGVRELYPYFKIAESL